MKTTAKLKVEPIVVQGEAWEWQPGVKCRLVTTDKNGTAWVNASQMDMLRDAVMVRPGNFVVKMPNTAVDFHKTFNVVSG